jgi:sugar/nucleoside kinase (ribokinase family)
VDVLFGNYHEAQALTDTETPDTALLALADHCDVAVVTMDSEGSLLRRNGKTHRVPAYRIRAVDTTGAGDMYAAGLIYGLARGLDLDTTGRIASFYAAEVVAKLGPRLEALPRPPSEIPPP